MTNLIGQVEAFQPGIDDWEQYTERLEQYFVANKVVDEVQQLAVFITIVGSKTYALLSDLLAPVKPADKSYKELKDVLKAHLKLKPLIIAERFRFHQRSQQTGEDVASYMAALRRLADKCSYGAHLEEALRDRFVCGLQGAAIQRKLLARDGLTLKTAYETAGCRPSSSKAILADTTINVVDLVWRCRPFPIFRGLDWGKGLAHSPIGALVLACTQFRVQTGK